MKLAGDARNYMCGNSLRMSPELHQRILNPPRGSGSVGAQGEPGA